MFACLFFFCIVCVSPIFFIDYLLVVSMCYKLLYQNANLCFVCSPSPFLVGFHLYIRFLFCVRLTTLVREFVLCKNRPNEKGLCRHVESHQGRKIVFGVVGIGGRIEKIEKESLIRECGVHENNCKLLI